MSEYQYNKVTPEMIEKFKEIAPKRVLVGDEINEDFTHDEMAIYGKAKPEVLVEATSTEEVAAVVKLCNENKVPVTPSGARTGLVGGAVSIGGGVMISLTKMNKILGYDKENFVVKIQSGVLLNDLAQDAEKQGLLYPPDPGEKFATVGGNVATNAGGMRAVKYGCTRDYVRAMTCETILLSLILMGLVFLIKWRRSLFREKSQIVTALIAVSVLAGMYPYMDYITKKQYAVSIGQQFLFILIIMIYMFLPLIAQETERRQENEKLLKALNDQFEIEKSHLKLMEDFETDQRKLEHDFNNQMMVVMGMMEMGEWMAAEDMLGEMEKRIGEV